MSYIYIFVVFLYLLLDKFILHILNNIQTALDKFAVKSLSFL